MTILQPVARDSSRSQAPTTIARRSVVKAARKVPTAARHLRRRNPKTGRLPPVKACGYALSPADIDAWAAEKNILQDETSFNREHQALQIIFAKLPKDFCWAVVSPHEGLELLRCIVIGSDETPQTLLNAYDPARAKLVHAAMGKDLGPPKWYYIREDFHRDY